eukprot:5619523-Pleurochrysis_carterae.AAC.1
MHVGVRFVQRVCPLLHQAATCRREEEQASERTSETDRGAGERERQTKQIGGGAAAHAHEKGGGAWVGRRSDSCEGWIV